MPECRGQSAQADDKYFFRHHCPVLVGVEMLSVVWQLLPLWLRAPVPIVGRSLPTEVHGRQKKSPVGGSRTQPVPHGPAVLFFFGGQLVWRRRSDVGRCRNPNCWPNALRAPKMAGVARRLRWQRRALTALYSERAAVERFLSNNISLQQAEKTSYWGHSSGTLEKGG